MFASQVHAASSMNRSGTCRNIGTRLTQQTEKSFQFCLCSGRRTNPQTNTAAPPRHRRIRTEERKYEAMSIHRPPVPVNSTGAGTTQAVSKQQSVHCPVCERRFQRRARQQRYCGSRCMRKANYARKAGSGLLLGQDTTFVRNPPKIANGNSAIGRGKTRSSVSVKGAPLNILGGHHWPSATAIDRKTLAKIFRAEIGDGT